MNMWDFLRSRLTIWVVLGSLAVAFLLLTGSGLIAFLTPGLFRPDPVQLPAVTLIPAPTLTPQPSPSVVSTQIGEAPAGTLVDGIGIGLYVQITGTGGDGLRLRAGPGTSNDPRFLGYEAEVFLVKDGPKLADGFTWWFLEAPYDKGRSGWAASKYLGVVTAPKPPQ